MNRDYLSHFEVQEFLRKWKIHLRKDPPKGLRSLLYMNQRGRLTKPSKYRYALKRLLNDYNGVPTR